MRFTQAVGVCFRKYATFSGRAGRSEFWWFFLFTAIVGVAAWFIPPVDWRVSPALLSPLLLPLAAAAARRLHDTGSTGWWVLAPVGAGLIGLAVGVALLLWVAWGYEEEGHTHGGAGVGLALIALFLAGVGGVSGFIALLGLLAQAGDPDGNRYGLPPGALAEAAITDGADLCGGWAAGQCAHCGAGVQPGAAFCTDCGATL